jgi:hypothetical protein
MCSFALQAHTVDDFFFQQKDCVQEKLYLTLDRPRYEAGDTIWFRGTLVAADNLSYLIKSNYIYVEWIDEYGTVLLRRKVRREGLCFQHNIPLEKTLSTGVYTLRAYTSWMRNFGEAQFFSAQVSITNVELPAERYAPQSYDVEVSFLPEGGNLLAGQGQWVAFRAVGNDGKPAQVAGTVHLGSEGAVLAQFRTEHDGMGRFYLGRVPETDSLCVSLRTEGTGRYWQGQSRISVAPVGYALAVTPMECGDSVSYRILSAGASNSRGEDEPLLLVLHSGTRIVETRRATATDSGMMDLSRCRAGISQLLLCTLSGRTLSRRLLFRYPAANVLNLRPGILRTPLPPRSLQTLELSLSDGEGKPLVGDFSVSVVDADFVETSSYGAAPNLQSYLLLSSDLHGVVYRPGWYFDSAVPIDERRAKMDLVMLTHGWSRFATDTLRATPQLSLSHPLEEHEWVSGRVSRLNHRKDRRHRDRVAISIVDTVGHSWGTAMLDTAGAFFVGDLDYPRNTALMVRVLSYSSHPHYHFDLPTYPAVSATPYLDPNVPVAGTDDSRYRLWLQSLRSQTVHVLDDVVVTERLPGYGKLRWREQLDAPMLSQEYDLYTYHTAMDIVNEVLRTRAWRYMEPYDVFQPISGAAAVGKSMVPQFILRNVKLGGWSRADALQRLYSEDVVSIDLVDRGGKFVIVTFRPGTEISDRLPNRRAFSFYGYGYNPPEYFYHPRYETQESREEWMPDLRKTLYWDPSLQSDAAGKIRLSFYTSDHSLSRRLILVEGVTFDGNAVSVWCSDES